MPQFRSVYRPSERELLESIERAELSTDGVLGAYRAIAAVEAESYVCKHCGRRGKYAGPLARHELVCPKRPDVKAAA